jgi:hypothetical protein
MSLKQNKLFPVISIYIVIGLSLVVFWNFGQKLFTVNNFVPKEYFYTGKAFYKYVPARRGSTEYLIFVTRTNKLYVFFDDFLSKSERERIVRLNGDCIRMDAVRLDESKVFALDISLCNKDKIINRELSWYIERYNTVTVFDFLSILAAGVVLLISLFFIRKN